MKPDNVCPIFLSGESAATILFKCALYWAEFGEPVWFISPAPINSLPTGWKKPPDKEILKLIYFIYLPETKDLLLRLSSVHLLPKLPKMIIITEMDHYLFPQNSEKDLTKAAFVVACLLDAASVFPTKFSSPSFLISCNKISNHKLQTIVDLYYSHSFNVSESTYGEIEELFNKYK